MNNTSAVEVKIQAVSPPEIVSAITGALIRVGNVRAQNRRLAFPDMGAFPWG